MVVLWDTDDGDAGIALLRDVRVYSLWGSCGVAVVLVGCFSVYETVCCEYSDNEGCALE
jgi:hypothetical protein